MRVVKQIIFMLLALLAADCGYAAGAERRVVTVGVMQQEPIVIVSRDGKTVEGLVPDILASIARVKGWQLRFVAGSAADTMRGLEQGTLDLAGPIPWPNAMAGRMDMSREGILASWGVVYVPSKSHIQTVSDLAGASIAVVRGDVHYANLKAILDAAGVRCEIVEMQRYVQILEAMERRQVDGGLVDALFGDQRADHYDVRRTYLVTPTVEFRFAAPGNRNAALMEAVDHWLRVYRASSRSPYHKALARWVLPRRNYAAVVFMALLVATLAGAGGVVFIVVRRIHRAVETRVERLDARNRQLTKNLEEEEQREKSILVWREWYRALFNRSHDAILVYGLDAKNKPGKYVEANDAACSMLGFSREELLALSPSDIEIGGDGGRPAHAVLLEKRGLPSESDVVVLERVFRSRTGGEVPVEVTIRMLSFDGRPVVMCAAQDISQRRAALMALKESERRFQDFFARSPIGVAVYDPDQKLTDVNQAAMAMFGLSERTQFGKLDLFHCPGLTMEYRQELLKGGTVRFEWDFNCDEERQQNKLPTQRTGRCRFDVFATNLGLDQGFNPKGFLVQIQDVTERRRTEEALRQNERILRQAQKMEAIGTLAGGIAHDFNNILTPIIGYAEMGLLVAPADSPIKMSLEEILKGSHRARDLVRQILAFSRQTDNEIKPVALGKIVSEVRMLLRGSIPPNVELRCDVGRGQDIVLANPTQLHQVIMNLCANALHAMKEKGGVLDLSLAVTAVTSKTKGPLSRLRPGEYVGLTVRDTGTGMEKKTLERIFEPFFTTKRSGEGTGMGLAVVHGIVTALNGVIHVESEPGKGSAFHVVLPLVPQAVDREAAVSAPLPRGTGTVLFVDDEGDIVTMAEQMLSGLGYTPVVCRGSQEALAVFQEKPGRFDLVISDQIMPGMSGTELVREIHRIRQEIPAILCTGFSKTVSGEELAECGIGEMLMKPILLRQMAEAVDRAMKGKPGPPAGA